MAASKGNECIALDGFVANVLVHFLGGSSLIFNFDTVCKFSSSSHKNSGQEQWTVTLHSLNASCLCLSCPPACDGVQLCCTVTKPWVAIAKVTIAMVSAPMVSAAAICCGCHGHSCGLLWLCPISYTLQPHF